MVVGVQSDSDQTGPNPVREAPRYLNRELSRLDFDERVLAMAADQAQVGIVDVGPAGRPRARLLI